MLDEFVIQKVKIIEESIKMTEPQSIQYLVFGCEQSEQSLLVQMGQVGEEMIKKIIMETDGLQLLTCGIHIVSTLYTLKNNDLDLVWVNESTKTIYYREAKGNTEFR